MPNLGGDLPTPAYGFPYLSGVGRLVIKDIIMMAGGLTAAAECANRILARKNKFIDIKTAPSINWRCFYYHD